MNDRTSKKRARDLQRITGMPYQSAHRAVTKGTEREASIRSGLNLSDFVTPREQRIWHNVNGTGAFECAKNRHWMPNEDLGQCVNCHAYLAQEYDDNGETYETTIDEERFLELCVAAEMYYNWAPPLAQLGQQTQAEYFWSNWRTQGAARVAALKSDPSPWDLEWAAQAAILTHAQVDLLQAIADLSSDSSVIGTRALGELLAELGKIDPWVATSPWHGTNPAADQLRAAGLIKFHPGMASPVAEGAPAPEAGQYGLELTDAGREALAAARAA